ncbi:hypothetical protein HDU77_009659 [Chytriomyces hyalinus]|nr:hypothetical protein HDU77_009659 [Chytriomyces hyalinus]
MLVATPQSQRTLNSGMPTPSQETNERVAEEQDENRLPDSSAQTGLFKNAICLCPREFIGQQIPPQAAIAIESHSMDEFRTKLYDIVHPFMLREILMQANGEPAWASDSNGHLSINAMDMFVLVSESSSKRKPIPLADLTVTLLVSWKSPKSITVFVQKYSNAMINSATFKKAHKKLLKPLEVDRAQAASESAFSDTVTTLKEIHGTRYIAADVHWGMWANEILSGEAHLIDHAINNPPPMHLAQFFKSTLTEPAIHIRMSRQANLVAINENTRILAELEEILESQLSTKRALEDSITRTKYSIANNKIRSAILEDFSLSLDPQENEGSRRIRSRIGNREDVDHAE